MKQNLKLVTEAFAALSYAFDSKNQNYAELALKQSIAEEKSHRGWGPDFATYHPNAASIKQCAKMFVVQRVAQYLSGERLPEIKDYFHTQQSAFMCAAMALEFRQEILAAWTKFDYSAMRELDYVQFVKPENAVAVAA